MLSQLVLIAVLSFALASAMLVVRNDRRQIRTMRRMMQMMIRQQPTKEQPAHETTPRQPDRR
ncbi:hypothetical protein Q31b_58800 [Novipirellula aureliae]|uniref:Uncharacterized protein n=1 Tax=Novipirellula aureliae TaxID=2527966 RepID=A0A5C6D3N4_9BACT|nr:hypothetical protein Q31b_58800 [Novipirellula aureliae]